MDLDELDQTLLRLVLEDGGRSLRELARLADSTAPTVKARLERLEEAGLLGPTRREVDLARLGTLVLLEAPPEELEVLTQHETVFQVHRTQQNRVVALALLPRGQDVGVLHQAIPRAQTHVLTERRLARAPAVQASTARVGCSQCGKAIEGQGREVLLGGRRYLACCPMCEQQLRERFERHDLGT